MIGDSIVRHAGETAVKQGDPNLGLQNKHIDWDGQSSMRLEDLHASLQYALLKGWKPWMILLHLGGNNIDNTNTWKIVKKTEAEIKYIYQHFPDSFLVWTDILPRFYWRNTQNDEHSLKIMDLKRKKVNRRIRKFVLAHPNGRAIIHRNIDRRTPGFFAHDGVHLSVVGYYMYLHTLSEAVSAFLDNTTKVFDLE